MEKKALVGFGRRLAAIRQGRGLTQTELGSAVGVSQRVIAAPGLLWHLLRSP